MKELSEYLFNTLTEYNDNIYENSIVWNHICIDFNLNNAFLISYTDINEKYGVYNGQIQFVVNIAKELTNKIRKFEGKKKQAFTVYKKELVKLGYENIFFSELTIILNRGGGNGYWTENKELDDNNDFKKVVIDIDINECYSYDKILTVLTHELTHAWENYNRVLSGIDTLDDILSQEYIKHGHIKTNTDIDINGLCKNIIYSLEPFEINAFLSELSAILYKEQPKIKDYNDAVTRFMTSDVSLKYINIRMDLEFLKYKKSKADQELFADIYNKWKGTNLTFNKIYKKLIDKSDKVLNKILSNVGKIYYDYMSENISEHRTVYRRTGMIPHYFEDVFETLNAI